MTAENPAARRPTRRAIEDEVLATARALDALCLQPRPEYGAGRFLHLP